MAKNKQKLLKKAKKRWLSILAPELFNNCVLGESLVVDANELIGRIITVNLSGLTDDIKMQSINVQFKIESASNDTAKSNIVGFEMNPSAIKRFVRRNLNRIDISMVVSTQDNINLRLKPFVLTENKAKSSVLHLLRIQIIAYLTKEIGKLPYEEVVKSIIMKRLQTGLRKHLKRVYPIKTSEIRYFHITEVKPSVTKEIMDAMTEQPPKEEEALSEEEDMPKPKRHSKEHDNAMDIPDELEKQMESAEEDE